MGIWAKSNKLKSFKNIFYLCVAACIFLVAIATFFPWVTDTYHGSYSGWEHIPSSPDWLHGVRDISDIFVGMDVFSVWSLVAVLVLIILILPLSFHFRSIFASLLLLPLWGSMVAMVINNIIVYGDGNHRGKYDEGVGWGLYFILCISILALALSLAILVALIVERILERRRLKLSLGNHSPDSVSINE